MSEFANTHRNSKRWQLLATVSAVALLSVSFSAQRAFAGDESDHPLLWIELGGQFNRLEDSQEIFAPVFPHSPSRPSMFSSSLDFQQPPLYSVDETGKLSFQLESSDWVFSASVRFGRSASKHEVHQQTYPKTFRTYFSLSGHPSSIGFRPFADRFADTNAKTSESHSVLDFQAGKDVGLGMFGSGGSSVISLGVRFAQFSSKSDIAIKSNPDWKFSYKYAHFTSLGIPTLKIVGGQPYHTNAASLHAERNFRGVGPSLSWNASAPFVGNEKNGELTVDWGLNAALLFGRQRAKTHHQATGQYHPSRGYFYTHPRDLQLTYQGPAQPDHMRMRNVTVPNVGATIGLTYRVEDFKISAGYRADLFFNAMDGGIDTRKSENVGFYGPFASVSVGLGG